MCYHTHYKCIVSHINEDSRDSCFLKMQRMNSYFILLLRENLNQHLIIINVVLIRDFLNYCLIEGFLP